jgi:hypothetical protein
LLTLIILITLVTLIILITLITLIILLTLVTLIILITIITNPSHVEPTETLVAQQPPLVTDSLSLASERANGAGIASATVSERANDAGMASASVTSTAASQDTQTAASATEPKSAQDMDDEQLEIGELFCSCMS